MNDTITIDGVVYSEDKKVLIKCPEESQEKTFYIPDSVEELGDGCFSNNEKIKNVFIGKNVKKIGNCALGHQFNFTIKKIYIPSAVTEFVGEIFDRGVDDGGECSLLKLFTMAKLSLMTLISKRTKRNRFQIFLKDLCSKGKLTKL